MNISNTQPSSHKMDRVKRKEENPAGDAFGEENVSVSRCAIPLMFGALGWSQDGAGREKEK